MESGECELIYKGVILRKEKRVSEWVPGWREEASLGLVKLIRGVEGSASLLISWSLIFGPYRIDFCAYEGPTCLY